MTKLPKLKPMRAAQSNIVLPRKMCTLKNSKTAGEQVTGLLLQHKFAAGEELLKQKITLNQDETKKITSVLSQQRAILETALQKHEQLKYELHNGAVMSLALPLTGPLLITTLHYLHLRSQAGVVDAPHLPQVLDCVGGIKTMGLVTMGGILYSIGIVSDKNFIPLKQHTFRNHLKSIQRLSDRVTEITNSQ